MKVVGSKLITHLHTDICKLSFRPVPPQSDLQASIPAGRLALPAQPFVMPTPAFGPGSVEYIRQQTEELEVDVDDGTPSSAPGAVSSSVGAKYAGAGAYY